MKKAHSVKNLLIAAGLIMLGVVLADIWGKNGANLILGSEIQHLENISPKDAYELIGKHTDDKNFVILDVRTAQEVAEGYIDNAINLDFYSDTFRDELNKLDKRKMYLIYCRSGMRSAKALRVMQDLHFSRVYNITGGMLEWYAEGLPAATPHSDAGDVQTPTYTSKYVGEEYRAIKSLSEEDIQELEKGGGWGLAKAAELNGVPGPAHLLEMKEDIALTPEQVRKIEALYETMRQQAIQLGTELIELERQLNSHFAQRTIREDSLRDLLEKIGKTRIRLRYVHLATHLKTPDILTPEQITRYNTLRGYASEDPCANIPEGHDPEMWKKHNNCP